VAARGRACVPFMFPRAGRIRCSKPVLADFPLINKSFELCYACVDR